VRAALTARANWWRVADLLTGADGDDGGLDWGLGLRRARGGAVGVRGRDNGSRSGNGDVAGVGPAGADGDFRRARSDGDDVGRVDSGVRLGNGGNDTDERSDGGSGEELHFDCWWWFEGLFERTSKNASRFKRV
jgi:hypothetical protein